MRKECRLLKHISHVAILHGDIDASFGVEENAVAYCNASFVWSGQSGHTAEQRGLARSRCAEEHRDARRSAERHVECEAGT